MDELSEEFDNLKISAFNKVNYVTNYVHNVTLGPNSPKQSKLQQTTRETCNDDNDVDTTKKDEDDSSSGSISYETNYKLPLQQIEQQLENQRQEQVRKAINQHISKFENFTKSQESNNEWLIQQQNFIDNFHQQEQLIMEAIQIDETRRRDHNNELSKHYQEITQRKLQIEQQLQQKKERQKLIENSIESIRKYYMNFRQIYQDIVASINSCQYIEDVKESCLDEMKLLRALPNCFDDILNRCKTGKVIESDVCKSSDILCQLKSLQDRFNDAIKTINDQKMNEELKKRQQQQEEEDCNNLKNLENQFISQFNLERYNEIRQFYVKHTASFQQLLNDDSLKQFRFDCKKAINIPVNAISAVNSEHLKDKYLKLSNLLSGKNVIIADRQINASKHPQGIQFCMDLLAKKFVLQGDLMISSNPEAAFTYSTIILSIWNDFPDFGRLLLAHFYQKCPYLIPYYLPKIDQQTDQEYYESLGYQYINDQIEKQDKYLKRLTGILRLYFAMMISKPKRSQSTSPFNIKNAWLYLVSVLKLPPQLDVTATILHIFLETIGFEMENIYGRCFKKLLKIIQMKFLPELKKLDSGGPVTRLEVLLHNYQTTGKFEKPNGMLSVNFW